jgi:putative membrane protein
MIGTRFPNPWKRSQERLRAVGSEPDYRFSLANERTFLAYLRTAIAFFAAGVAVLAVVDLFDNEVYDSLLGASMLLVGLLISGTSYGQWRRREEAIRRAGALPYSPIPLLATVAVTVIGSVTLIVTLIR